MSDQLVGLRTVLEELHKIIQDQPDLQSPEGLRHLLTRCQAELDAVEKKLKAQEGRHRLRESLIWPFQENDLKKVLDYLADIRDSMHATLQAIHMSVFLTTFILR